MNGKAELRLEANYFNEELSEWEPLIEKLETKDGSRPWELSVGVSMEWCMVWYGIWYMVYGIWYMVYGIWYMVYGIWYMVYGMVHGM